MLIGWGTRYDLGSLFDINRLMTMWTFNRTEAVHFKSAGQQISIAVGTSQLDDAGHSCHLD
jgi:hypothetical protein